MENILMTCITSMFLKQKRKFKPEPIILFLKQISPISLEIKNLQMEWLFQPKNIRFQSIRLLSKDISHAKEKWKSSSKNLNNHTQKKTFWKFYHIFTEDMVNKNSIATIWHCQRLLKLNFQKAKTISKLNFSRSYSMSQKNFYQSFLKRAT